MPDLPSAIARLRIALADLEAGPVRSDLEHALAIATFDADTPGEPPIAAPVPEGRMFAGLPDDRLTQAMDELQRALLWEADNAVFVDAELNRAVYLRAAGYLDRAAATRYADGFLPV
jgi:hypothetical protein